jgi:hypothetical protein
MIYKKIILLIVVFFSISFFAKTNCSCRVKKTFIKQEISPKKRLYGKYTELEVCNCIDSCFCQNNNSDTFLFVKGYPIFIPKTKTEWEKEVEYFEPRDTLAREILIAYGGEYVIDTLIGMKSTDYTGAYYLSDVFSIEYRKKIYILLLFFDGYQMGTEQQSIYVIFETENNNAVFRASYVANNNYRFSQVRIVKKKGSIFLKSKNLDKWK